MKLFLVLALCVATACAQSWVNLRFTHQVMGQLQVSSKKFPLLTPVGNPDIVYITPTAAQLNVIMGKTGRRRRQTTALDPALQKQVRDFLAKEFGSDVTAASLGPLDASELPFKSFGMINEYDLYQVPKATYNDFVKFYKVKLDNMRNTTPWYPANQIYNQLNICPFVYYGSTGSQDVRFESANGGIMAYYQVTCSLDFPTDSIALGIEFYGTRFELQPVVKVTQMTLDWNSLFGTTKTITGVMYENRALTAGQIKVLLAFLRGLVVRSVRSEYGPYLFPVLKTESGK